VGSPSAAVDFPNVTSAAAARGVGTVTYSRAGFAGSTRKPGRTVADEAGDVAALADHLGAPTFLVAGWSGGGPGALACAALLPDRVRACAVIASASPPEEVGPTWFEWWNEEDVREELRSFASGETEPFRQAFDEMGASFAELTADDIAKWPGTPEVDRAALDGDDVGPALADSIRRAVGSGIDGWMDDESAETHPWGFHVADIRVPVTVRHGELDHLVRVDHGRWLAGHVPDARAEILPDHGHTSVAVPFDDVIDGLLADV
jgi:pimeloyl-ACP methyl ester carboxylesterase